ncbi:GAF domain-containing protein [Halobellus sp. EA9]|uniref:GAF domain-containing protein n=1 Tax=Halobellus sp. EA9 TaxID=3421647 RepID=UPI003EB8EDBD
MGDEPAGAHVDAVVHRVHRALVAADTRADLESASCRAFVSDEPYALAWIGVHDDATDRIVPTASAGEDASYLDGLAIRVHDAPTATEPSATALKTATTQVRRRLRTDPDAEPWRDRALAHGFESSIAIPLVTDWVAYGVLSLYSRRPDAFDDAESALLTELGETIATAIVGIEARAELEAQRDGLDLLNEVVRHDIRNTLQVISGYGDLLEPHVTPTARTTCGGSSRARSRPPNSPTPRPTSRR